MTEPGNLSRRSLIAGTAGLAGAAALAPRGAIAQASPPANAQLGTPASTITTPAFLSVRKDHTRGGLIRAALRRLFLEPPQTIAARPIFQ